MKNFIFGAIAMLVLFIGGYFVLAPGGEEVAEVSAEAEPSRDTTVVTLARSGSGGEGNGGVLVFIGGEYAVAKTLEAAEEAEAVRATPTAQTTANPDPRPGPTATATATATSAPEVTPAPERVCVSGPYVVYFDLDSASVNASAAETLNRVAQQYRLNCPGARVAVAGHTDEGDGRRDATRMSQRMAASVAQYLGSRGVPGGSISTEALGRSQPRVRTEEGVSDPQNRRVEITFGRS